MAWEIKVAEFWDLENWPDLRARFQERQDRLERLMEDGWEPMTAWWSGDYVAKHFVLLRRQT